jgi:hypothetical protein
MISRTELGRTRMDAGFARLEDAAPKAGCSRMHLDNVERGAGHCSEALVKRLSVVYRIAQKDIWKMVLNARQEYLKLQIEGVQRRRKQLGIRA